MPKSTILTKEKRRPAAFRMIWYRDARGYEISGQSIKRLGGELVPYDVTAETVQPHEAYASLLWSNGEDGYNYPSFEEAALQIVQKYGLPIDAKAESVSLDKISYLHAVAVFAPRPIDFRQEAKRLSAKEFRFQVLFDFKARRRGAGPLMSMSHVACMNLADYMQFKIGEGLCNGAKLRLCEQCEVAFWAGGGLLNSKRGDARFCSQRCVVRSMRARNSSQKGRRVGRPKTTRAATKAKKKARAK